MFKIIEVALIGKFGTDAVPSLMEVIGVTPNAEMATEILLGIYEKPTFCNNVLDSGKRERTLLSVDEWNRNISYSYEEEITKSFYIHKDTDTSLITDENYKEFVIDSNNDDAKWFNFNTGVFTTRTGSCDFAEWIRSNPLEFELEVL